MLLAIAGVDDITMLPLLNAILFTYRGAMTKEELSARLNGIEGIIKDSLEPTHTVRADLGDALQQEQPGVPKPYEGEHREYDQGNSIGEERGEQPYQQKQDAADDQRAP